MEVKIISKQKQTTLTDFLKELEEVSGRLENKIAIFWQDLQGSVNEIGEKVVSFAQRIDSHLVSFIRKAEMDKAEMLEEIRRLKEIKDVVERDG